MSDKLAFEMGGTGLHNLEYCSTCLEVSKVDALETALNLLKECVKTTLRGGRIILEETDGTRRKVLIK